MLKQLYSSFEHAHQVATPIVQDIFLLFVRLVWGWGFFEAGLGKVKNFERTTKFFESLSIPAPELNAAMAAGTEMIGGLLLLLGFASRIVPLPLIFTMLVAYGTAHREELASILSFPSIDPFLAAPPFLFLMASLIVLLFGSGRVSIDRLIKAKRPSNLEPKVNS